MRSKKNEELEYKWQAHSIQDYKSILHHARTLGAKIEASKTTLIQDYYLDSPEKIFQQSQAECRIRIVDGHFFLILKGFSPSNRGPFQRLEKSFPLPSLNTKSILKYCQDRIFKKMLGRQDIEILFEIQNNRLVHSLHLPDGTVAEASFDDVHIPGKTWYEIELEFKQGDKKQFIVFGKKLSRLSSLKFSKSPKFNTAMAHLFGKDSIAIRPIRKAACHILEKNLNQIKSSETAVRLALYPEAVHDMRVAIRKLRLALKIFKEIYPAKQIEGELKSLNKILGIKRNLDVFLTLFPLSNDYQDLIMARMDKAQNQILKKLNSKSYATLIKSIEQLKPIKKKLSIKLSKKVIKKQLDLVSNLGLSIHFGVEDKALHKLRIAIRKLRYSYEFFDFIFCSKIKKLQELLGECQNAVMGIEILLEDIRKHPSLKKTLTPNIHALEKKKRATRKSFFKKWNPSDFVAS